MTNAAAETIRGMQRNSFNYTMDDDPIKGGLTYEERMDKWERGLDGIIRTLLVAIAEEDQTTS